MAKKIYRTQVTLPFEGYEEIENIISKPKKFKKPIKNCSKFLDGTKCILSLDVNEDYLMLKLKVEEGGIPNGRYIENKYRIYSIEDLIRIYKIEYNDIKYLINIDITASPTEKYVVRKLDIIGNKLYTNPNYIHNFIDWNDLSNSYRLLEFAVGGIYYIHNHIYDSKDINKAFIEKMNDKLSYYGHEKIEGRDTASTTSSEKVEDILHHLYFLIETVNEKRCEALKDNEKPFILYINSCVYDYIKMKRDELVKE